MTDERVKNPEFAATVRESFSRQTIMAAFGAELAETSPGLVRITYRRNEAMLQQHGFMHARAGTSVTDSACGYAALTLAPAGHEVLTVELKINFLKPADGEDFEAIGTVIKAGRTIAVTEGELWQNDGRELIAKMQATMIYVAPGTR